MYLLLRVSSSMLASSRNSLLCLMALGARMVEGHGERTTARVALLNSAIGGR